MYYDDSVVEAVDGILDVQQIFHDFYKVWIVLILFDTL